MRTYRDLACAGKAVHPSAEAARAACAPGVSPYECRSCGAWHAGHDSRRRQLGVPWAQARLIRVTAVLQQGAALDPRWPLPLDGLLASAARRAALGEAHGAADDPVTADLPLARLTRGAGARWSWAASCARPAPGAAEELHYWHRRVPHAAAEKVTGGLLPPQIYEGHGRYRAHRTPLPVTVTPWLEWSAAGDPAAVAGLLDTVWAAGRKRSQGEGAVLSWDVADLGAAPEDAGVILWHPDGTISRPVAARAAASLGVAAPGTVPGAYRPPYWRPPASNTSGGRDGGFAREWQEVIAPWTTRPSTPPSSPPCAVPAARA